MAKCKSCDKCRSTSCSCRQSSICVQGDPGPIGPRGLQGIQGPPGPEGPQGPAGPVNAAAGTYVPILTPILNIASSSQVTGPSNYMRVLNVCTVSGVLQLAPTTDNTVTEIDISLPIASDIQFVSGVAGTATTNQINQSGMVYGNAAQNRARLELFPGVTGSHDYSYHFTYLIT